MAKKIKIVVIGGGTGSFTVLSGLKKYKEAELTAIVSMADDGGSTGVLRDEYGVLPPGDVRQCLVALSEESDILRKLFNFRFSKGSLKSHNFGNLFISAAEQLTGDFDKAILMLEELLKVNGSVVPVTLDKVRLIAELKNGKRLQGEGEISDYQMISRFGLERIYFDKVADANPKAIEAIEKADVIVVGPGSFYASLIPNFLVSGISEAVKNSKAKKIFICNLMNKYGHTDDFTVQEFVYQLEKFTGEDVFDFVVYNNKIPSQELLKKYIDEGEPVFFMQRKKPERYVAIGEDILSKTVPKKQEGDTLKSRALIRHDQKKLAKIIMDIAKK